MIRAHIKEVKQRRKKEQNQEAREKKNKRRVYTNMYVLGSQVLCYHLDIETSKTMYNRKIKNSFSRISR